MRLWALNGYVQLLPFFTMQGNNRFPCIHDLTSYLNQSLKLDNLYPTCKNASEKRLRCYCKLFQVAGISVTVVW